MGWEIYNSMLYFLNRLIVYTQFNIFFNKWKNFRILVKKISNANINKINYKYGTRTRERKREREKSKIKIKILCFISLFEFILFDYYLFKFFFSFWTKCVRNPIKIVFFSYFKLEFLLKFSLTEILFFLYI